MAGRRITNGREIFKWLYDWLLCFYGYMVVTDWIVPLPPNSYIAALTSSVTVFGERAFKAVIKVKWDRKGEPLMQQDWWPDGKRKQQDRHLSLSLRLGTERRPCLQARKRGFTRHQSWRHLDLAFPASRAMRNKFLLSKARSLCEAVMAAERTT